MLISGQNFCMLVNQGHKLTPESDSKMKILYEIFQLLKTPTAALGVFGRYR
jgi:hypothetical protein